MIDRCSFCNTRHRPRVRACEFCNKEGLEWHRIDGWYLYSPDHVKHVCEGRDRIIEKVIEIPGAGSYDDTAIRADIASVKTDVDALAPMIVGIRETFEAKIPSLIERVEALDKRREVVLKMPDKREVKAGMQHKNWPMLCEYLNAGLNVALVGPAGSGKTSGVEHAMQALGMDFYPMSFGPQTSESKIIGYMDANGKKVETNFTKWFEHGGGFLGDEFDAANSAVTTIMNAATSGECPTVGFPWGNVKGHPNRCAVVNMNTYGRGADAVYVGRAQLDGATLDRWTPIIQWDYDWDFVRELTGNDEWTSYIEKLFNTASDLKLRIVIGPRKAITGAKMLAMGVERKLIIEQVVWAGIPTDARKEIEARIRG